MARTVKITHQGPYAAKIEVDGRDLAPIVRGYSITADLETGPRVCLEFSLATPPDFDGPAELDVTEDLREALIFLGWTPPAAEEPVEAEITGLNDRERTFLRPDGTKRTEPWD